jgi:hypothetical protein
MDTERADAFRFPVMLYGYDRQCREGASVFFHDINENADRFFHSVRLSDTTDVMDTTEPIIISDFSDVDDRFDSPGSCWRLYLVDTNLRAYTRGQRISISDIVLQQRFVLAGMDYLWFALSFLYPNNQHSLCFIPKYAKSPPFLAAYLEKIVQWIPEILILQDRLVQDRRLMVSFMTETEIVDNGGLWRYFFGVIGLLFTEFSIGDFAISYNAKYERDLVKTLEAYGIIRMKDGRPALNAT